MSQKDLHEVIEQVITNSIVPLSVRQIADIISKDGLWNRPKDGKSPPASQISARVNNYNSLFKRENGVVFLRKTRSREARLCKLVYNNNSWMAPSERSWNPKYVDDPNKGYEQKHGFGHEEWLFNPQFLIGGYQYGFIQGVNRLNPSVRFLETLYLFTITPNTKQRFYVGKIRDVEVLHREVRGKKLIKAIEDNQPEMINQLQAIGANYAKIKSDPYNPNIRFETKSIELLPEWVLISNSWFDKQYFRTMPYEITGQLLNLFQNIETDLEFRFIPSTPFGKKHEYERFAKASNTTVVKTHQEMEVALYNHLLKKGIPKNKIACDTASFGGKLADVVVENKEGDSYEIYEIKTQIDLRRGLREAIGQLIDYSSWQTGKRVSKIYAVLPQTDISNNWKTFLLKVKDCIRIDLDILLFDKAKKTFLSI